jgi:hypothetical protein
MIAKPPTPQFSRKKTMIWWPSLFTKQSFVWVALKPNPLQNLKDIYPSTNNQSLIVYKQTKHQKPKMKKTEWKGNKQANKQHPKKREKKWFCLLSSLSCREIWLSPLLDDGQPTHLTILLIKKQWSGDAVCSQKPFVWVALNLFSHQVHTPPTGKKKRVKNWTSVSNHLQI